MVPAMGCTCCCPRRRGYENLDGGSQAEAATSSVGAPTIQGPQDPDSQEPAVEFRPPSSPIQVTTCQPPSDEVTIGGGGCTTLRRPIAESTVSSDRFIVGREGLVFSRREEGGYVLRIFEGSFQNEVDVTVTTYLPDSAKYSVRERDELVSGVCHIASKETELEKSGSLVIYHCINIRNAEDRDSVGMVTCNGRRESDFSSGSYQFQPVDERDVDVRSDCVGVKLRKLEPAYYAVVCAKERRGAVGYRGMLYRLRLEADLVSPMKFIFIVVKDLNCFAKVVEEDCAARNLERAYVPVPVTFAPVPGGQEMKLTLDMERRGIRNKGWHIYPCAWPAEIRECDVHDYHPETCHIPSLELQVVWDDKTQPIPGPERFLEFIGIKGTIRPQSLTLQDEPHHQEIPRANDPTVPSMMELFRCVGQKGRHNIPEEIGRDYSKFGIFLLNDKHGTKIDAIEQRYLRHAEEINREILCQWLKGKGRKPVKWATLITVLKEISRITLAEDIEYGLMGRELDDFYIW